MTFVANLSQVPVAYDNTCLSYTLHIFQFLLSQRPETTTKKVQQKMETIANTEWLTLFTYLAKAALRKGTSASLALLSRSSNSKQFWFICTSVSGRAIFAIYFLTLFYTNLKFNFPAFLTNCCCVFPQITLVLYNFSSVVKEHMSEHVAASCKWWEFDIWQRQQ